MSEFIQELWGLARTIPEPALWGGLTGVGYCVLQWLLVRFFVWLTGANVPLGDVAQRIFDLLTQRPALWRAGPYLGNVALVGDTQGAPAKITIRRADWILVNDRDAGPHMTKRERRLVAAEAVALWKKLKAIERRQAHTEMMFHLTHGQHA